jgi:hypothetical protein
MYEHNLTIDFDLGTNTVTDCLPMDTFDVSSLKKETPNGPEMDVAPGDEELDARAQELSAIEDFIAQNGVSVPTVEDFKPKKQSWRGKKSKKTDVQVASERRGRPRKSYTKSMTFVIHDWVLSPTWEGALWKRAGRGRAKTGEFRKTFDIHHTHLDTIAAGARYWTGEELLAMGVE